ncbi:rho GTPase-activating protein 15-like isoform X4 [Acropora millepora]|uniref:rho GTPase-activating protein 15-like isoform X4 n=1 Tax=Acropora millepora TaxID=45264 RepID=UPI0010FCC31D|nr:rho GTPase-activating protein 15-like isoform X4 [Acropora millepora]
MANGIVEALFPYSYEARDERIVSFSAGDRFTLLDKTNDDWWQVQKESEKPIYVPASYMKELIIPIYENMTSISNHPHNGEDRLREQNGRSYESLDKETDVESTVLDRNCNSDSDHNNYQGNGHVVEVFEDSNTVSRSSSGVKSNSLDVKSLANSLESTGIRPGGSFSLHKPDRPKSLSLPTGWRTMTDDISGRPYYFNSKTGERSWKPPRNSYSKAPPSSPEWLTPPLGWKIAQSSSSDEIVFVNDYTDEEWVPSVDYEGRVYYYPVNGGKSVWELPEFHHERTLSVESRGSESGSDDWPMPPTPTSTDSVKYYQEVIKQGVLKVGSLKKNKKIYWTPTFVTLLSSNLVFYKDQKAAQKYGLQQGKPERTCTLQGASLEWLPSPSNKKKPVYQFQIKALTGVFILQHDNQIEAQYWFNEIAAVINKLNEEEPFPISGTVQYRQGSEADDNVEEPPSSNLLPGPVLSRRSSRRGPDDKKKEPKQQPKTTPATPEDSYAKGNIRKVLKLLLIKRPTIEELERKGIIKESVFGCHIGHLCERERTSVPLFVNDCIAAIEKRGLSFDGLYRVCGNVSTVQKLRIMVDQEEKVVLGEAPFDDVHALTGSLKLYFRELPEPLIPYDFFSGFVTAIKQSTRKDKLTAMRSLAAQMPKVNCETLKLLLRHLRKLMEHSETNRMTAQNLAIVWGPNLMWPRYDSGDIAINMVHQNQIIEFLLLEYDHVFK